MKDQHRSLLFFYTETPLHAGSGAGLGAIDLPLQRERMSDLPQVQGSGIKGALRELFRAPGQERSEQRVLEEALFGPRPPDPLKERSATNKDGASRSDPDPQAQEHAGALAVTDARLLLMPVRTAHGGWAWITSPLILQRLARDMTPVGGKQDAPTWASLTTDSGTALVSTKDVVIASKDSLIIEDAQYEIKPSAGVEALAKDLAACLPSAEVYAPIRTRLAGQLVVLSDEEMCYWAKHGTEVVTRVRIDDETGTVSDGALWTEEALPSESLLWSVVMMSNSRQRVGKGADPLRAAVLDAMLSDELEQRARIFLGGDRTVGRGLVSVKLQRVNGGTNDVEAN